MDSAVTFGSYTFEQDNQIDFRDNFGQTVAQILPIFGADGGFDEYGTEKSPSEIGKIAMSFWLYDNMGDLDNQKRAVREMSEVGLQRLTAVPNGVTGAPTRWCNARVINCHMLQSARARSQVRQRVSVVFSVPDPFWNATGASAPIWGRGFIWGDPGAIWGGAGLAITASGLETDGVLTPGGNAMTAPLMNVTTITGQEVRDFRIQRVDSAGTVLDECRYDATITENMTLLIDCRGRKVTLAGNNAYNSDFTTKSGRWFGLVGGEMNSVKVLMDRATDACTVTFGITERIR